MAVLHLRQIVYAGIPDEIDEDVVPKIARGLFHVRVPEAHRVGIHIAEIVLGDRLVDQGAQAEPEIAQDEQSDDENDYPLDHDGMIITPETRLRDRGDCGLFMCRGPGSNW